MIRIVLADDHSIVLDGLEQVLRLEPDLRVVARCTTGEAALQEVEVRQPDVLLLDLAMPKRDGLSVLRALRSVPVRTRVILLTAHATLETAQEALDLGAHAIVLKEQDSRTLVEIIRKVAAGHRLPLPALHDPRPLSGEREPLATLLTPREREIVNMAARGLRNREIAARLSITEGTVKLHLHNIYEKLGVNGRPELMRMAVKLGLG